MIVKIKYSWYLTHIYSFIHSVVFVFRNEETLVAKLFHSSFGRVATSMLRKISVFTSSGSQNRQAVLKWEVITESLRVQYSTSAQHSDRKDCDVNRQVSTERVRNKYSLLVSFTLYCSSNIVIDWLRQFDITLAQ